MKLVLAALASLSLAWAAIPNVLAQPTGSTKAGAAAPAKAEAAPRESCQNAVRRHLRTLSDWQPELAGNPKTAGRATELSKLRDQLAGDLETAMSSADPSKGCANVLSRAQSARERFGSQFKPERK